MKNIIFIILSTVLFISCKKEEPTPVQPVPDPPVSTIENIPGTYYKTIDINGDQRQYIVYVPQSVTGTTKVPVLFMIHGTNQTGQYFYNTNMWNNKADQEGFIVVYPTALIYCHYDAGDERTCTKWAAGDLGQTDLSMGALPLCPGEIIKDDLLYFDEMIESLKSEFAINEKRIYASGFSNGAQMASRLAAERSNVFASIAVHAGNLSNFIPANLSNRPMSMIITVGNKDSLFTEGTGISNPAPLDASLMSNPGVAAMMQRFLDINGLDNQFNYTTFQVSGKDIGQFDYETSLVGGNNSIRFFIIENLAHNYTEILIDGYWDFLSAQSLP